MNRRGQAILVILMVCLILGILAGAVLNFQRGQVNLLSRSASDYLALNAAEAGLHCVLAEMKADYQFVTHGNPYIPAKPGEWPSASVRKYTHVKSTGGLRIDDIQAGAYSGSLTYSKLKAKGRFKTRVKLMNTKNNAETKTVDEAHRYFLVESLGNVESSYRKISVIIEKISPANFILYDGQILDLGGYGPYRGTSGELRVGRLYGHEMINFSKRGTLDRGLELLEMEKISTPGTIRVDSPTGLGFMNGKKGVMKRSNDSTDPAAFESFGERKGNTHLNGFVLDGHHGAKPQKLPMLNPAYYKNAAKPAPKILKAGSSFKGFGESWWRNPYKPNEVVYDLFFGWDYENKDDKVMLYSEVPLRVWGCPPWKALTIFCEKDVYIAGDFNANPDNPQNYNMAYKEYTKPPRNGTDKNGVAVLSLGRIWFDYSNPMNFLRNEMETVIDYELAKAFANEEISENILMGVAYPPRLSTGSNNKRMPMTMLHFITVNNLFNLPKQTPEIIAITTPTLPMHGSMKKLRDYLSNGEDETAQGTDGTAPPMANSPNTGGGGGKSDTHFYIKSAFTRTGVYEMLAGSAYTTGTVLPQVRDRAIRMILDRAERDIEKEKPDSKAGAWNIATRMFNLALKHPQTGFRMPEMTVNALLVDSAELNNRWSFGNDVNKVNNELGNVQNESMRSFQWISNDSRFILRHHGAMVHLRNRPADVFVSGAHRNDQPVLRRLSYDRTYAAGGGDYHPPYPMAGFTMVNWKDEISDEAEFKSVK
jgi:hypothetical protein